MRPRKQGEELKGREVEEGHCLHGTWRKGQVHGYTCRQAPGKVRAVGRICFAVK